MKRIVSSWFRSELHVAPACTEARAPVHDTPRRTNALISVHQDQDAAWSNRAIAAWGGTGYQATVVAKGELIAAARRGDWSRLSQMSAEVQSKTRDEVFVVALLRLLANCPSDEKWPAIKAALAAPSPWVRAAAAESAGQQPFSDGSSDMVAELAKLTRDPVRLPRIRAANALTSVPSRELPEEVRADVAAATAELGALLAARPDDFACQYDLGRLYAGRCDSARAQDREEDREQHGPHAPPNRLRQKSHGIPPQPSLSQSRPVDSVLLCWAVHDPHAQESRGRRAGSQAVVAATPGGWVFQGDPPVGADGPLDGAR
jgi:hypothetical protein